LHKIQQLMHEQVRFAPLVEPVLLNGYGPRVADSGLGLIVSARDRCDRDGVVAG
jgi:hypothetical protein